MDEQEMTDNENEESGSGLEAGSTGSSPRFSAPRLSRLAMKELRETLRDRRTIVTLILMPLLVYPILSLVFRTFLFNTADSLREQGAPAYKFVIAGDGPDAQLFDVVSRLGMLTEGYIPDDLSKQKDGPADEDPAEDSGSTPDSSTGSGENQNANPEDSAVEEPPPTDEEKIALAKSRNNGARSSAVATFWEHDWNLLANDSQSIEEVVANGSADVGLRLLFKDRQRFQLGKYDLIYDPENPVSASAARYLTTVIDNFNEVRLRNLVRDSRMRFRDILPQENETVVTSKVAAKGNSRVSLASMIPLILVLMTITGAVYPAIDLTAGERERGTLETLMAAPVPRMGILFSKFVAVLTVAVLTATLNIAGMVATVWAFGLDDFFGHDAGLTFGMIARIFGLLVLFAAFFSAILLAVTSYARSFKEAQSYLIPIILLSMAPGLMAMSPGLTLDGPLCVTPMVNLLLLARDVLQQKVLPFSSLMAIVSTLMYTGCAIFAAARIFGTDAILYGSQGSWSDIYQRPRRERSFAPVASVAFSLALLFPLNFMMIAILGRFGEDVQLRLGLMGLFTFISFVVVPWIIARHQRVDTTSGFGLIAPRPVFLFAALLLGVSLWPIVMSLIAFWHDAYAMFAGVEESSKWHDQLVKFSSEQATALRAVPPISIAISLALIPAICEEWFFRGFLLRGLLKHTKKWNAIILSALLFGLFHTLSGSVVALDRLIPTVLIGIALGYLCYKSNSILPGILLHMLHNGIVAFLAYYQPKLSQFEWFPDETQPIPMSWLYIALVPALLGAILVAMSRRSPMELETEK